MTTPPDDPSDPRLWYQQPGQTPPPQPAPPTRKRHRVRNSLLAALGVVVVLGVVGAIIGPNDNPGTSSGQATTTDPASGQTGPSEPPQASVTTAPAPPTHSAKPKPATLLEVRGSGIKTTRRFSADRPWTMYYDYDCSNFGYQGNFAVTLYQGSDPADILSNELGKSGKDHTENYTTGDNLHLEINSECDWHVKVATQD
jgi:hypothetical protein